MDSSSDENVEGSESASPASDPTSPPYSVETTESSGKARIKGQGTALEFTPVREPEPAVDFVSEDSYVAQTLKSYQARGVSLEVTRGHLIEVIKKCDARFKQSMSVVLEG